MYIVVGLGNPGKEYEKTRHNIGFMVIDRLADKYNINVTEKKNRAFVGSGYVEGQKVMLVKPQTFMNLSGESVGALINFFKIDTATELIVVYDDISLEPGNIRIRKKGSAGGHNGMKSIIAHVQTMEFLRVRVGIGEKPEKYDLADYVLGKFSKGEEESVAIGIDNAVGAIELIVSDKTEMAMNQYNKKLVKGEE